MRPILTFDRDRCLACLSCELACSLAHSTSELLEAAVAEPLPPRRRVAMAAGKQVERCMTTPRGPSENATGGIPSRGLWPARIGL